MHMIIGLSQGSWLWFAIAASAYGPSLLVWWYVTEPMVRGRVRVDRAILDGSRIEKLEQRVDQVVRSRRATVDHNEAELRRIERDLHDGAQARIAAAGMNVGLAEKLIHSDPDVAAGLLREARETTVSALEDLRTLVRGIHPPVLADRGLVGGIEALAIPIPIPVTVSLRLPRLAAPIESAVYFAVAECLANVAKHARASRAWVVGDHDGETLRLTVGDDGRGGADPRGSGLAGVARRLSAFDGVLAVTSPAGGGTEVRMEVRCRAV
jgi:signal transduction histidine kinase